MIKLHFCCHIVNLVKCFSGVQYCKSCLRKSPVLPLQSLNAMFASFSPQTPRQMRSQNSDAENLLFICFLALSSCIFFVRTFSAFSAKAFPHPTVVGLALMVVLLLIGRRNWVEALLSPTLYSDPGLVMPGIWQSTHLQQLSEATVVLACAQLGLLSCG